MGGLGALDIISIPEVALTAVRPFCLFSKADLLPNFCPEESAFEYFARCYGTGNPLWRHYAENIFQSGGSFMQRQAVAESLTGTGTELPIDSDIERVRIAEKRRKTGGLRPILMGEIVSGVKAHPRPPAVRQASAGSFAVLIDAGIDRSELAHAYIKARFLP
jgi:hypothetical protein